MLVYCWLTVYGVGPTKKQRWANVSTLAQPGDDINVPVTVESDSGNRIDSSWPEGIVGWTYNKLNLEIFF